MKKILIILLAAMTVAVACKKENGNISTGVGEMTLSVKCSNAVYTERPMVKSASSVDVSSFVVTITKLQDEYGAEADWNKTWTVAEFPKVLELAPGKFSIKVVSPEVGHISTEHPSYMAEQEFTIIEDVVTPLEIVCEITNMKVSVAPTESFFKQLSSYTVTLTAEYEDMDTPVSAQWTQADIDKVIYLDVAKSMSVMVTGIRTLDGSDAQLAEPYVITSMAPKDHHILNLDVQLVGELSSVNITIDSDLNDRNEDLLVDGFEEIPVPDEGDQEPELDVTAPYMLWDSNPTFKKVTITDGLDVNIDIFATKKIESFIVRVSDNFKQYIQVLTEIDPLTNANKDYMDLINDKTLASMLQGELYLPTGDEIYGKKYVFFPLSSLVPLVKTVVKGEDVQFILELKDFEGQELTKTLTFYSPEN